MPTLSIVRSDERNNRIRKISIYIDGKKSGEISNGETKSFEIHSGQHHVEARIDWCGSNEVVFSVAENEIKKLDLCSFTYGKKLFTPFLGLIGLYYISFGRREYLVLK